MGNEHNYVKGGESTVITNRGNKLRMVAYFPKENPKESVEFITMAMAYLGLFDGIQK